MEQKIRVMIADDDAGMRLLLGKLVSANDAFIVVADAEDGDKALELAAAVHPQVVFIDIDMPKKDGLSCAKELCAMDPDIAIIFATAHDGYMSDAFALYAYDYLVKPFKAHRVYQTLARLEKALSVIPVPPKNKLSDKLTIRNRDGILFLNASDIIFIEHNDRISLIVTTDSEYQTTESLSDLEARLDPNQFMRSHRSYLINTSFVRSASQYGRWTYTLGFDKTERQALITYEKMEELQNIL